MAILALYQDLDPTLQLVEVAAVVALALLVLGKTLGYLRKRRARGKIWLVF